MAIFVPWFCSIFSLAHLPFCVGFVPGFQLSAKYTKKFSFHFSSAFVPFSYATSFRFKLVPTLSTLVFAFVYAFVKKSDIFLSVFLTDQNYFLAYLEPIRI